MPPQPTSEDDGPEATTAVMNGPKQDATFGARLEEAMRRVAAHDDPAIWTDLFPTEEVFAQLDRAELRRRQGMAQPLYGLTFAVKDNIDYAGRRTTAGCPEFGFVPRCSAPAVQNLCDAGAICLGKTTLDQFATGLVGTRSPHGTPRNPFNPAYIPGGSSSGSAVAVAAGLVDFSLGTDTAGSGRVPAAFNNIVGYKPTRGLISTAGVVPACRSLDCVSVFAASAEAAIEIAGIAAGIDRNHPDFGVLESVSGVPHQFRFGIPSGSHLQFFGDEGAAEIYRRALVKLSEMGGTRVEIDFAPFSAAGRLLYGGPWIAERLEAAGQIFAQNPGALLPLIREILAKASRYTAAEAFTAMHELRRLAGLATQELSKVDLLALPTAGTIYTLAQIEAEPLSLNSNLGYYTQFANLLNLCAVSVPSGFRSNGLPTGLMLVGAAAQDRLIAAIGGQFHRSLGLKIGATTLPVPPARQPPCVIRPSADSQVRLAVLGAHLSGQPLNHQLLNRAARFVVTCRTAPRYRFYALEGTVPPKPGLERVGPMESGKAIELEVWEMSQQAFGGFVAAVQAPMAIGTIELEDGSWVKGFLCEPYALAGATDISIFGGWRAYLQSLSSP